MFELGYCTKNNFFRAFNSSDSIYLSDWGLEQVTPAAAVDTILSNPGMDKFNFEILTDFTPATPPPPLPPPPRVIEESELNKIENRVCVHTFQLKTALKK